MLIVPTFKESRLVLCHMVVGALSVLSPLISFHKQDPSAKYSAAMLESLWPEMEPKERNNEWKNVFNLTHQIKNKLRFNGVTLQQK